MTINRDELRAGVSEATLNKAGYAVGVFKLDGLTEGQTSTYAVQEYHLTRDPGFREKNHTVEALSAEHAISLVSKRRTFAFTRQNQNSADELTRDNAHYQIDPSHGFNGFIARRV